MLDLNLEHFKGKICIADLVSVVRWHSLLAEWMLCTNRLTYSHSQISCFRSNVNGKPESWLGWKSVLLLLNLCCYLLWKSLPGSVPSMPLVVVGQRRQMLGWMYGCGGAASFSSRSISRRFMSIVELWLWRSRPYSSAVRNSSDPMVWDYQKY